MRSYPGLVSCAITFGSVPGVADVAPIGGYTRQYQVTLIPSPARLWHLRRPGRTGGREGNNETSARLLDFGGTEYMVRGRGYAKPSTIRKIVVSGPETGAPIRVKDIGEVVRVRDLRRGVADLNGQGEVVSGIVIMRSGENALEVIDRVKAGSKRSSRHAGRASRCVPVYDRSQLDPPHHHNARSTVLRSRSSP